MLMLAALKLILLTGPGQQVIEVNPAEIASIRQPRGSEHLARGTRCLIFTADGKFFSVRETCAEVQRRLMEDGREPQ